MTRPVTDYDTARRLQQQAQARHARHTRRRRLTLGLAVVGVAVAVLAAFAVVASPADAASKPRTTARCWHIATIVPYYDIMCLTVAYRQTPAGLKRTTHWRLDWGPKLDARFSNDNRLRTCNTTYKRARMREGVWYPVTGARWCRKSDLATGVIDGPAFFNKAWKAYIR